jgi:hypothetical protein
VRQARKELQQGWRHNQFTAWPPDVQHASQL